MSVVGCLKVKVNTRALLRFRIGLTCGYRHDERIFMEKFILARFHENQNTITSAIRSTGSVVDTVPSKNVSRF